MIFPLMKKIIIFFIFNVKDILESPLIHTRFVNLRYAEMQNIFLCLKKDV